MRELPGTWRIAAALALAVAPAGALPAWPQTAEELDQLVQPGEKAEDGVALARSQISAGALLEALATLERTLAVKPKSKQAKLLHAGILCQIDDRTGAAVEFGRLKAKDFSKDEWAEAQALCAAPAATAQG